MKGSPVRVRASALASLAGVSLPPGGSPAPRPASRRCDPPASRPCVLSFATKGRAEGTASSLRPRRLAETAAGGRRCAGLRPFPGPHAQPGAGVGAGPPNGSQQSNLVEPYGVATERRQGLKVDLLSRERLTVHRTADHNFRSRESLGEALKSGASRCVESFVFRGSRLRTLWLVSRGSPREGALLVST
jgi:hypothetical protein